MGWTNDGENDVYYLTGVEVTASRLWDYNLHNFLYESFQHDERNQARLGEMQNWWMSSVYNWKGPAGTIDFKKGSTNLSPNPNDKGNKTKQDLTKVINEHLTKMDKLFSGMRKEVDKTPLMFREIYRIALFGLIQKAGKDTDFFNPKQSDTYKEGGDYYGVFMKKDDIGNFIYGSAAYSMGLSIDKALVGAGAFGIWNGSEKHYGNIFCLFDEFTDSFMIIQGFYRYRAKK